MHANLAIEIGACAGVARAQCGFEGQRRTHSSPPSPRAPARPTRSVACTPPTSSIEHGSGQWWAASHGGSNGHGIHRATLAGGRPEPPKPALPQPPPPQPPLPPPHGRKSRAAVAVPGARRCQSQCHNTRHGRDQPRSQAGFGRARRVGRAAAAMPAAGASTAAATAGHAAQAPKVRLEEWVGLTRQSEACSRVPCGRSRAVRAQRWRGRRRGSGATQQG